MYVNHLFLQGFLLVHKEIHPLLSVFLSGLVIVNRCEDFAVRVNFMPLHIVKATFI